MLNSISVSWRSVSTLAPFDIFLKNVTVSQKNSLYKLYATWIYTQLRTHENKINIKTFCNRRETQILNDFVFFIGSLRSLERRKCHLKIREEKSILTQIVHRKLYFSFSRLVTFSRSPTWSVAIPSDEKKYKWVFFYFGNWSRLV